MGFNWRHGWIPLTPYAVALKLHHAHGGREGASQWAMQRGLMKNGHYRTSYTDAARSSDPHPKELAEYHLSEAKKHLGAGRHREAFVHSGAAAGYTERARKADKADRAWGWDREGPAPARKTGAQLRANARTRRANDLEEYRVAKEAERVADEKITMGGKTEARMLADDRAKARLGRADRNAGPLTWKKWLQGKRQSPDDDFFSTF